VGLHLDVVRCREWKQAARRSEYGERREQHGGCIVMLLYCGELRVSWSAKLHTRRCQLARNARAQNVSVKISQPRVHLNFPRTVPYCPYTHDVIVRQLDMCLVQ
jgi:hypothetical protein